MHKRTSSLHSRRQCLILIYSFQRKPWDSRDLNFKWFRGVSTYFLKMPQPKKCQTTKKCLFKAKVNIDLKVYVLSLKISFINYAKHPPVAGYCCRSPNRYHCPFKQTIYLFKVKEKRILQTRSFEGLVFKIDNYIVVVSGQDKNHFIKIERIIRT